MAIFCTDSCWLFSCWLFSCSDSRRLHKSSRSFSFFFSLSAHQYNHQFISTAFTGSLTQLSGLELINIVILCPARPLNARTGDHLRMGKPPWHRTSTQVDSVRAIPPWVGKSEYWLWLQSPIGTNSESCITVGPVTRTAGILAYSRLKALGVNAACHLAICLRNWSRRLPTQSTTKGMSSLATTVSCLCEIFLLLPVRK